MRTSVSPCTKVYFAPFYEPHVGVFNTTDDTYSTIALSSDFGPTDSAKYSGAGAYTRPLFGST